MTIKRTTWTLANTWGDGLVMEDPLVRALGYPYAPPETSCLWREDGVEPLAALPDLTGRHPVIGCGSNQAPEQLLRKYGGHGLGAIPVLEAWFDDLDSVYAAQFSPYGACPATLASVPGVKVRLFVTWLDDAQLARMHETEGLGVNYDFGTLSTAVTHFGETVAEKAFTYVSLKGCLTDAAGDVLSLSAVRAEGRAGVTFHEKDVQAHLRDRLAPDMDLDAFILSNIENDDLRLARIETLGETARTGAPDGFVSALGD